MFVFLFHFFSADFTEKDRMKASEVAPHRVACVTVMINPQKPEQSAKNYDARKPDKEQGNAADNCAAAPRRGCNRAGKPVLALFPKVVSMVSYPIVPFSPGREAKRTDYAARVRTNAARSHSGPITSIFPKEARGNKKGSGFESQEPTSPKVSCIGQVKLKKNRAKKPPKDRLQAPAAGREPEETPPVAKTSKLKKLISMAGRGKRPPPAPAESLNSVSDDRDCGDAANYPSLGQLKRFSCGRDPAALADLFKGVELSRDGSQSVPAARTSPLMSDSQEYDRDGFVDNDNAASGYLDAVRLMDEPLPKPAAKNGPCEINLWKRRSMAPPVALNLRRPAELEVRKPFST